MITINYALYQLHRSREAVAAAVVKYLDSCCLLTNLVQRHQSACVAAAAHLAALRAQWKIYHSRLPVVELQLDQKKWDVTAI